MCRTEAVAALYTWRLWERTQQYWCHVADLRRCLALSRERAETILGELWDCRCRAQASPRNARRRSRGTVAARCDKLYTYGESVEKCQRLLQSVGAVPNSPLLEEAGLNRDALTNTAKDSLGPERDKNGHSVGASLTRELTALSCGAMALILREHQRATPPYPSPDDGNRSVP
jgi:hypothetical protein